MVCVHAADASCSGMACYPAQLEALQVQLQAFLLLRRLHLKLNKGDLEEEDSLVKDICAPSGGIERGQSLVLGKFAWFPATVSSSPAAAGDGGGAGKLQRVALVLGQTFFVRSPLPLFDRPPPPLLRSPVTSAVPPLQVVAEIDGRSAANPCGTAKLVVPMHHIQSVADARSAHVLHLRIWSSKPVLFAK